MRHVACLLLVLAILATSSLAAAAAVQRSASAYALFSSGEHLLTPGVLRDPSSGVATLVDSADEGLLLVATSEYASLALDYSDGSPVPKKGLTWQSSAGGLALRGLLPGTSVQVRHRSSTAGQVEVDGREVAFEGGTGVLIHGRPSIVTVDLTGHGDLSGTVVLDTAVSERTGGEVLVISSASDEFQATEIECDGIDDLVIIAGTGSEPVLVGDVPHAFRGVLHVNSDYGSHDVLLESYREPNYSANVTGRITAVGRAPCGTMTGNPNIFFGGSCTCSGTTPLEFIATDPGAVVDILPSALLQTDAGLISFTVPDGMLTIQGGLTTNTGNLDVAVTCTTIDCIAFVWGGSATLGGDVNVQANGRREGLQLVANVAATSLTAGTFVIVGNLDPDTTTSSRFGIIVQGTVTTIDYDVSMSTTADCSDTNSAECVGFFLGPGALLDFRSSTVSTTLAMDANIETDVTCSTAACVGARIEGTIAYANIAGLLSGKIQGTGFVSLGLGVDMRGAAFLGGSNANLLVVGDTRTTPNFRQAISISSTDIDFGPGGGGNGAVTMDARIGETTGNGGFFEFASGIWNFVDVSITTANSPTFGGFVTGINSDTVMMSGSTLTVHTSVGTSTTPGPVAGWIDDTSIVILSGNAFIRSSAPFGAGGSGTIGIDWSGTTLVANSVDIRSELNNDPSRGGSNIGINLDSTSISVTAPIVSFITGISGCGIVDSLYNHGVVFQGLNNIDSEGDVFVSGTSGPDSLHSHGIALNFDTLSWSTAPYSPGDIHFVGTGQANNSPLGPNHGIFIDALASIEGTGGNIKLDGTCSSFDCSAVHFLGTIEHSFGDIHVTGTNGHANGAYINGVIFAAVPPVDLFITGSAAGSNSGDGVVIDTSFAIVSNSPVNVVISGVGTDGGTNDATGVIVNSLTSTLTVGDISVTGQGGDTGSDNRGIDIQSNIVVDGTGTFVGDGGCSISGTNCIGVLLGAVLTTTMNTELTITGSVAGGNFPVGVSVVNTIQASGDVFINSSGNAAVDDFTGVAISGTVATPSDQVVITSPIEPPIGGIAVDLDGGLIVAPTVVVTGTNVLGNTGKGVAVRNSFDFASSPLVLTIRGEGQTGIDWATGVVLMNCSLSLEGVCTGSDSGSIAGISFTGSLDVAGSSSTVSIQGTAGAATSSLSNNVGIFVGADLVFNSFPTAISGYAGGASGCTGLQWSSGNIFGSNISIDGNVESSQPTITGGNSGIVVTNTVATTLLNTNLSLSGSAVSIGARSNDVGVIFAGNVDLSSSVIEFEGFGGNGGNDGNVGVLFADGGITCSSPGSGVVVTGIGDGTGSNNAGVVFGQTFSGFDGSSASLGDCQLTVVGEGSASGTGSDNSGINFEGTFTSDTFSPAIFTGLGHGDSGHGIFLGPSTITFGLVVDSVTLDGTANSPTAAFGIACDGCNLVSLNGNIVFNGGSPVSTHAIAWSGAFNHPVKIGGDFTFNNFAFFASGFSLDGSRTDLYFNGGVRFDSGVVNIDTDRVEFHDGTTAGSAVVMDATAFPTFLSASFHCDADSNVRFGTLVFTEGDVLVTSDGTLLFDSAVLGDVSDITLAGAGTIILDGGLGSHDNIYATVSTLEVTNRFFELDAFSNIDLSTTVNFENTQTAFVTFRAGGTINIGADIIGSAGQVWLEIGAPTISFAAGGVYSLSGEIYLVEEIFLEQERSAPELYGAASAHVVTRSTSSTPEFGQFIANLPGTFAVPVFVAGNLTALASGTFTNLTMSDSTWLKPGTTVEGTGCCSCNHLELEGTSTAVMRLDGPPPPSGGCNNLFDRIDLSGSLTIGANVQLDCIADAGALRGEVYDIIAGQSISSGVFAGFPEGSVVSASPDFIISYLGGAGADVTLRGNELPVVEEDMYTIILPHTEPAPGVLTNDSDPDFDSLSVASFSPLMGMGSDNCALTVNADGSFGVTGSCLGLFTFTYSATDGLETSGPATVTLDVVPPSPTPTGTPTMSGTPSPTLSRSSTVSLSPSTTSSVSESSSATVTPTSTTTATRSPTTTASATKTGTATASETGTATQSTSTTATATKSPTGTGSSTGSPTPTASLTPSTTMSVSATATASSTASETPSSTSSPTPTKTSSLTSSVSHTSSTTQSVGASASKTPTQSFSKSPTVSASKSPTRSPSTTRTPSKTGTASHTPSRSPSSTHSVSRSPSHTRTPSVTGTATRTSSKTPSKTGTPTASLSRGSTPSATPSTTESQSSTMTASATASSSPTSSASRSATTSPSSSATTTGTASATLSPTGSASASVSPTGSPSEALPSPSSTPAAASATPSPTPIIPSAVPTISSAAASRSANAEAPGAASITPTRSRSRSHSRSHSSGGAAVLPTTVPRRSASVCIGTFCVSNPTPASNEIPLEVELLPEGSETIKEVRNQDGKEVGRVRVPSDSGGAVLVVNQASSDVRLVEEVVTDVVDVTIVDSSGNVVSEFEGEELEVCFSTEDFDSDEVCLGFYNDDGVWECQDYCLSLTTGSDGEDLLCGNTPHLTNFALLLSDEAGSESRCGSSSLDLLYVYLSIGAVGLAIFVILVAVVARESHLRWDVYQTNKRLTYGGAAGRGLGSTGSSGSEMASFSTD